MRAVIQRVQKAVVRTENRTAGQIDRGLLILAGLDPEDERRDLEWMARKVLNMRIFDDEAGNMNKSVIDLRGEVLIVSQFTLHASTKKGNRPSFTKAAAPDLAERLYNDFTTMMRNGGVKVETGVFGAHMEVELINDGPVTIMMDSKNKE